LSDFNKAILVIANDKSVLRTLSLILKKNGYEVEVAQTDEEAREKATAHCFDVIIIDYWYPDSNGIELLKEMPKNASKAVKILITTRSPVDLAIDIPNLDVDCYLPKPVKIPELLSLIEEKLKNNNS
jgi:DNA-binding NtrC family response regulator